MASVRNSLSPRPRRVPKKGAVFLIARGIGLLLTVLGLLLFAVAAAGFFVMLVRVGPLLVDSAEHLVSPIAGFVFIGSLVYLVIFPVIGWLGAAMAGVGLLVHYVGTEPAIGAMPGQAKRRGGAP